MADTDANGELSQAEFVSAVRGGCSGITPEEWPDQELQNLFRYVDADKQGTISAPEFSAWLTDIVSGCKKLLSRGMQLRMQMKRVQKFSIACASSVERLAWQWVFARYDQDGSGALDHREFVTAVRTEFAELHTELHTGESCIYTVSPCTVWRFTVCLCGYFCRVYGARAVGAGADGHVQPDRQGPQRHRLG
jgi:hypothetical protein